MGPPHPSQPARRTWGVSRSPAPSLSSKPASQLQDLTPEAQEGGRGHDGLLQEPGTLFVGPSRACVCPRTVPKSAVTFHL